MDSTALTDWRIEDVLMAGVVKGAGVELEIS